MAVAGYATTVRKSGTATSMTSQAMSTNSTVANTYQINSTARRVWSRSHTLTFRKGGTTLPASAVTPDYLFGKVVISSTLAGSMTVSGTYLPMAAVAGGNSYSLTMSQELLDDTDFSSTGWTSRIGGLLDVSLTVNRWDNVDLDFYNLIDSGNPVVVDIRPGGSGSSISGRGYFLIESENRSGDVSGLEGADVSFQLDASTLTDFSWGVA